MPMPSFTMRQLLEAGLHYGHTTRRWNPKMEQFLFGVRNGIHIINLEQTVPLLLSGHASFMRHCGGWRTSIICRTKPQAAEKIKESAKRCGQYYINHRWLGGP